MKKIFQIIMLPMPVTSYREDRDDILLCIKSYGFKGDGDEEGKLGFGVSGKCDLAVYKPQSLYVLSDQLVANTGDYICDLENSIVYQVEHKTVIDNLSKYKRVITSNDYSLELPLLSPLVEKQLIGLYNKGYKNFSIEIDLERLEGKRREIAIKEGDFFDVEHVQYDIRINSHNEVYGRVINDPLDEILEIKNNLPIEIIRNMIKYCEDMQIYDKLGAYGDFYYKGLKWLNKTQ